MIMTEIFNAITQFFAEAILPYSDKVTEDDNIDNKPFSMQRGILKIKSTYIPEELHEFYKQNQKK